MKPLRLPEWTKDLPDSAFITSAELAKAMGMKNGSELWKRADMPPHVTVTRSFSPYLMPRSPTRRWRLGAIRAAITEQER